MSIVNVTLTTSKVVVASYRILATSILGYYLIKETVRREKYGREIYRDGGSPYREPSIRRNRKYSEKPSETT